MINKPAAQSMRALEHGPLGWELASGESSTYLRHLQLRAENIQGACAAEANEGNFPTFEDIVATSEQNHATVTRLVGKMQVNFQNCIHKKIEFDGSGARTEVCFMPTYGSETDDVLRVSVTELTTAVLLAFTEDKLGPDGLDNGVVLPVLSLRTDAPSSSIRKANLVTVSASQFHELNVGLTEAADFARSLQKGSRVTQIH